MWEQALKVAIFGFSVVFSTLLILSFSVKFMSFICKKFDKKKGGK
jgi:Na+-transporting methylmalonyl-CoA/oxaloacetate decarboxylase gamma subunit